MDSGDDATRCVSGGCKGVVVVVLSIVGIIMMLVGGGRGGGEGVWFGLFVGVAAG